MINDTNALRALVNEYLPSTVGSEMFLRNKFVLMNREHFVAATSLDNNELFITKCPLVTDTIIFKVDIQQQRRDDEVAAIRKIETKKNNIKISPIEKE